MSDCIIPTSDEITRVKGLGFLRDKTTPDCFNARVITRNGKVTAEQFRVLAEAAERYGSGELAMTTRMTVEIQRVPYANIEPLCAYLAEHGMQTGGTGPRVRPVVSCKGTTCQYGLIDTFDISLAIHERFYEGYHAVKLPHKFKIAVGGCPNNCVKPDLNDVGIIGQCVPVLDAQVCRKCKTCQVEKSCPMKAVHMEDGMPCIDRDICNSCGRCVARCPFHAMVAEKQGYRVYIGGRWGKRVGRGQPLARVFTDREELLATVEKTILFFRAYGQAGERLADTVARVGFAEAERLILSDELHARKAEILAD